MLHEHNAGQISETHSNMRVVKMHPLTKKINRILIRKSESRSVQWIQDPVRHYDVIRRLNYFRQRQK